MRDKLQRDGTSNPRPAPVTTATFPSMLVIRLVSGNGDFLILVLKLVKLVVQPALRKKFLVGAHFPHAAFVHDEDLIALLNRGKPMRDDDRCSSLHRPIDRLPDLNLRLRIHARSGFVQNQDLGIVRKGAGKRQQLPLTDGERRSPLIDLM